jgi:hypothetical protein
MLVVTCVKISVDYKSNIHMRFSYNTYRSDAKKCIDPENPVCLPDGFVLQKKEKAH